MISYTICPHKKLFPLIVHYVETEETGNNQHVNSFKLVLVLYMFPDFEFDD